MTVLFYSTLLHFRKSIAFRKVPRLRPFCLELRATCRRRWVWSVGGMRLTRIVFKRFSPYRAINTSPRFSPLALHNPLCVCVYFTALYRALASSRRRLLDHTQRSTTVGNTPLNEWSVRRRHLYPTTHNTHNRQTSMPRVGFEPTIAAGERP